MIEEMGIALPSVKAILIDERDRYMAHNIRCANGSKVVAIIGAAHMPGILRHFDNDALDDISDLNLIPEPSLAARASAWLIPGLIVVVFIAGFFLGDKDRLMNAAFAWILATGSLSALGVGFFTGLTHAWIVPPTFHDLEHVSDDVVTLRDWWGNRVSQGSSMSLRTL